jgi:hypothetical protein
VSLELLDQLAAYGEHHRASQTPIALSEIVADETETRPAALSRFLPADQPGRSRPWRALAAATLVVLLVGGLVWLAGTERQRDPADDPKSTTTNPTSSSTTTTSIALAESFAPFISGQFVGESASTPLGIESYETSQGTFSIWSADQRFDWIVDWKSMFEAVTPLGDSVEWFLSWDPSTGILEVALPDGPGLPASGARLRLSISGTPEAWTIAVENPDTNESISEITGSLPGHSLDEILEGIVPSGRGDALLVASFFVTDETGTEFVSPPWEPVFVEGEAYHVLVVNDTLLVFVTLNVVGAGQITVWSSADGRVWEDLGPAPWSGHANTLESLVEVEGQVVAMTRKDIDPNIDDEPHVAPGQVRYWSSVDGATWVELTLQQWQQFGLPPPDTQNTLGQG